VRKREKKYSLEFQQAAVERMKTCSNVAALARELQVRCKWLRACRPVFSGMRKSNPPMTFPRWTEAALKCRLRRHRRTAFPAGYSLTSCTPAALVSASPAAFQSATTTLVRPDIISERLSVPFHLCH
jgi:transposase-like protein